MNELKRELLKVVGDVSDSEVRVRQAVSRRVQKRRRKWLPAAVVVAALSVVLLFTQLQANDTSATLSQEEYAYYLFYESVAFERDVENYDKTRAFKKLLERAGRVAYGKSLGLVVSEEEIMAQMEGHRRFTDSPEYEEMLGKVLHAANVSEKTYRETILYQQAESSLMGELIVQQLRTQYEQLNDVMARHMMNHYAVDYMEEHYAKEVAVFRAQYQIEADSSHPSSVMGVIGLVEGNMFYLIEDATFPDSTNMGREELIATYFANEKGAWYPNVDGLDVSVGDIIRVPSGTSGSEDGYRVGMNYGGAEILQRAAERIETIRLVGEQAATFTEHSATLDWETNTRVSMIHLPDYTVTANGVTYSIWAKYNNSGMEIVRHDPNAYVNIPKSKSAPIYELLQ